MMSCFGKQLSWLPGNNQTQTHPEMLRGDKDVLSPTLVEEWRAVTQPVSALLMSDCRRMLSVFYAGSDEMLAGSEPQS